MIQLKNVTLRRGVKVILDNANLTIHPHEKVALIGRNGAGKSTLFALLNGSLHEDYGTFNMPAQWSIAQVEQTLLQTTQSATDFVMGGDVRLTQLKAQAAQAQDVGDAQQIADAHIALSDAGAHSAMARAQSLILGLGFKNEDLLSAVDNFSGGWRMRLQLARTLMAPSDLLLLDEPTNHLDLDALIWLENWLKRYEGTVIIISHDRDFLDATAQVTVHLEQQTLTRYSGNYSQFEKQRAQKILLQEAQAAKQQAQIAHLQNFISRFKAKASKAKQAQSRVKALARMQEVLPILGEAEFRFEFQAPRQTPNPMLVVENGGCGYGPLQILQGINLNLLAGQRIGVLGANGQGKSTLIKTLVGQLDLQSGQITSGKGLNIGYFAQQELDVLNLEQSAFEHMVKLSKTLAENGELGEQGTREQDLRNFLGSFNFSGDLMNQAVGSMSGGEKARLVLCMIVWQRPNLLVLDEPTNHLDITTRSALSLALNAFEGSLLLVSHDRALLREVCDEFWLVSKGEVQPFNGDLIDYQNYLLDLTRKNKQNKQETSVNTSTTSLHPIQNPPEKNSKKLSNNAIKQLEKNLEQWQLEMDTLQQESSKLQEALTQTQDAAQLTQMGLRIQAIATQITHLENQWLQASETLEMYN